MQNGELVGTVSATSVIGTCWVQVAIVLGLLRFILGLVLVWPPQADCILLIVFDDNLSFVRPHTGQNSEWCWYSD